MILLKNLALKEVVTTPIQGAFGYKIYSYNEPHFIINKKEDDLVFVAPNGKGSFKQRVYFEKYQGRNRIIDAKLSRGHI